MLNESTSSNVRAAARRAQRGVILIVALIVLVALSLAAIVMMRSVDITNIIAGNLAFKQAATRSGDIAVETALAWLQANNTGTFLHTDQVGAGYSANGNNPTRSPAAGVSWETFWGTQVAAGRVRTLSDAESDFANTGNRMALIIDRMCANPGNPNSGASCTASTVSSVAGASGEEAGELAIKAPSAVYYRITARVVGPRNTVSYVQAMATL
jgi:Tfp pilus assembly protein PilX